MPDAKIFTLFSSSKGNCCYIKYKRDEILIDCGASARSIDRMLNCLDTRLESISAIFITHEHNDHIRGLETIAKHFKMPIFAPENCVQYLRETAGSDNVNPLKSFQALEMNDLALCPIATPHDARGSVGFRIRAGEEKIGYFTDIGHLSEGVLRGLSGCNRVIIESNHDTEMLKNGSYPYSLKRRILGEFGHLSNELCASLLPHLVNHGSRSFMLAHLSEHNNTPETAFNESLVSLHSKGIDVNTDGQESVRLQTAKSCGICELK